MKILFILCEGAHDAQFIGRLLEESGKYSEYEEKLKDYPEILRDFISGKLQRENIDSFRIGRPRYPLIPIAAFFNEKSDLLVLPIPLGGMDKFEDGLALQGDLREVFDPDILEFNQSVVKEVNFLFVYDADARGRQQTIKEFQDKYRNIVETSPALPHATWCFQKNFWIAIFVFTGEDGNTGTLEDLLVNIFRGKNPSLFEDAEKIMNHHFEKKSESEEQVAYHAKRNKGLLTICGQQEKKNVGSSLTVVLRDSAILSEAFDFDDTATQWSQLLTVINACQRKELLTK
ncbi:MAG: hypothetical protein HQL07_01780 [Nitrospirae bacterium]|nr:hypothetical protein [Magnetococcales bacterium]HAT51213.1 hypothetical protein [Alphaproteobacteria bacterium]